MYFQKKITIAASFSADFFRILVTNIKGEIRMCLNFNYKQNSSLDVFLVTFQEVIKTFF